MELIAQADETGLAASGLACLDRCVPLFGDGVDEQALRPLWANLADGTAWDGALAGVRRSLEPGGTGGTGDAGDAGDPAGALARRMLAAVPAERTTGALRTWADGCSAAALQIHRLLDATDDGVAPLVAAELRRQIRVLELLAGSTPGGGLRQVLDVSTEGRRVLRAVVSRRARTASG
ncbi:hypothetical protein [Streptomyces spectabilis]|uniref:Uncharacterized protein n=1 Tax=Streptomyces spectabilis TaxID=68270 RepID=A0A516RLI1_STRST|nr:hypothetical protein [Streptomyces spectabilis]QDQ16525.1 hypothetical protein FH965_24450 [Streptomyces spectabilis]